MSKEEVIPISLSPAQILHTPLYNKGTAFTQQERDDLGLNGLLPVHISTTNEQILRCYKNFCEKRTPVGKYVFLNDLLNRNEILFYLFVERYAEEMLPYIYTPTVGEAALHFSLIYTRQRGLYLSYPLMNKMDEMIQSFPEDDVHIIVVTDGERILGLGDQGIGGIAIPIGKLSLYSLFGGIHPAKCLPVILDVGTNNQELLEHDLYLGWRHRRLSKEEYDPFVEAFIRAIKKRYPKVLLQWEDFGKGNARRLLDHYKDELLSFNDDIEGTASTVIAAILSAIKGMNQKLIDQKIVILGGGSAGTGIADLIAKALILEGLSSMAAREQIYMIDVNGLIHSGLDGVSEAQRPYETTLETIQDWKISKTEHITLMEVIENTRPSILIGVSAQRGAFTQEIIQKMHAFTSRPIILPLSNPTSRAEATPEELIEWTHGQAIIATGSPFGPVVYKEKSFPIAQCNNVYIFPGLGLGALAAGAKKVTDGMVLEAAHALAALSPMIEDPNASIFPAIKEVRKASREIAIAVARKAAKDGVSSFTESEMEKRVDAMMWEPRYARFVKAR